MNAPSPKNKRLTKADRVTVLQFASKQIKETADTSALDAAYEVAADAIHSVILADNPPKDMKVLKRYGLADKDQCIFIADGAWHYDRFDYKDGDKRIILRSHRKGGCGRNPIKLEGENEKAFGDYKRALKALEDSNSERLSDFKALVNNCTTFNALVEAWPAVETLRESIVGTGTSLSVLSADTVKRIKSDAAFAGAAQ